MEFDHRKRYGSTGGAATHDAPTPGKQTLTQGMVQLYPVAVPSSERAESAAPPAPLPVPAGPRPTLQMLFGRRDRASDPEQLHAAAARGTATTAGQLPHLEQIQRSFGRHDVSGVQAHTGGEAAASAQEMGAAAYATGNHVVLGAGTDLHTVAHEAAHVVQQRAGVHLKGGVGEVGDAYERHADEVANAVASGASAEALLDQYAAPGASATGAPVQRFADQVNSNRLAAAPVAQPAPVESGRAPVQRVTLTTRHEKEQDQSYQEIKADAAKFHNAFGTGVLFDLSSNTRVSEKPAASDTQVDVFGHGNAMTVGDLSASALAQTIKDKRRDLRLADVEKVTIHACESGTPLDTSGLSEERRARYREFENVSLADQLHRAFLENHHAYVEVDGFQGETVTDRAGRTRVVKEGKDMNSYRIARREALRKDQARNDGTELEQDQVENDFLEALGGKRVVSGPATLLDQGTTTRTEMNEVLKWRWRETADRGETFTTLGGEQWGAREDEDTADETERRSKRQ